MSGVRGSRSGGKPGKANIVERAGPQKISPIPAVVRLLSSKAAAVAV